MTSREPDRCLVVEAAMPDESAAALERWVAGNPRHVGAAWADLLDIALDADVFVDVTDPIYEALEGTTANDRLIAPVAVTLHVAHPDRAVTADDVAHWVTRIAGLAPPPIMDVARWRSGRRRHAARSLLPGQRRVIDAATMGRTEHIIHWARIHAELLADTDEWVNAADELRYLADTVERQAARLVEAERLIRFAQNYNAERRAWLENADRVTEADTEHPVEVHA